jgi:hypothetical protein
MLYRNIRTGAEFDSLCPVSGEYWVPVRKAEEPKKVNLSEMTVAQLKGYALENGVDIGKATKKADIIKAISG